MRINGLTVAFPNGILRSKAFSCAGVAVVAALMAGKPANGALMLIASEPGFAPVTATEVGNTDQVILSGPVGDFTTNIVIGFTNLGSPNSSIAQLQVQSLDVENNSGQGGTKTLTVTLEETTPFTFPGTASSVDLVTSALGGTVTPSSVGDSISFESFAIPATGPAVAAGPATYTFATANTGTMSFQVPTTSVTFTQSPSYSLEDVGSISLAGGETANISGTTTVSVVPEPASIGLIAGTALAGLARRRRRA